MMSQKTRSRIATVVFLILLVGAVFYEVGFFHTNADDAAVTASVALDENGIPDYHGVPYDALSGEPFEHTDVSLYEAGYEFYSPLDGLGRCGECLAMVGPETMPAAGEERDSIGSVKPSGWQTKKYDFVSGRYLYNRCHLIGWQLTAENANPSNLVTGTRTLNIKGMLPFEDDVADYVRDMGGHVLYRASPVFVGDELVCRGVVLEGLSIEDGGASVSFKVFCHNVEPGVSIDYATGDSEAVS